MFYISNLMDIKFTKSGTISATLLAKLFKTLKTPLTSFIACSIAS